MRNLGRSLIFVLLTINCCLGQEKSLNSQPSKSKWRIMHIVKFKDARPLITENAFIDRQASDDFNFLEDSLANKLGDLLDATVIETINIKDRKNLLSLNDVLQLFKIEAKYWRKDVTVDNVLLNYPGTLIISKSLIESVKINRYKKYVYISIITKDYKKEQMRIKRGEKLIG